MQPPHVQDLLSLVDNNFNSIQIDQQQGGEEADSDPEGHNPVDNNKGANLLPSNSRSPISSPSQSNRPISSANWSNKEVRQSPAMSGASDSLLPTPFMVVLSVPIPVVISSFDTNENAQQQRVGNTIVRQKHVSGHTVIVDATKATGAIMASQMKDIAHASLEFEKSKIEVQMKLFFDQMTYRRDKD